MAIFTYRGKVGVLVVTISYHYRQLSYINYSQVIILIHFFGYQHIACISFVARTRLGV
jgi:hypothetical protein